MQILDVAIPLASLLYRSATGNFRQCSNLEGEKERVYNILTQFQPRIKRELDIKGVRLLIYLYCSEQISVTFFTRNALEENDPTRQNWKVPLQDQIVVFPQLKAHHQ